MGEGLAGSRARLAYLLRALFGLSPALLAMEGGLATRRPFLSNRGLHLPEVGRAVKGVAAERWYEAAALHAVAHLRYPARYGRGSLKPVQTALVGVLEDARVERLAMAELPGLRSLWLPYHRVEPAHGTSFVVLLLRLARCLLDPSHHDPHPWVGKGRALFESAVESATTSPEVLRDIASRLGHDIGQMRLPFNSRDYVVEPIYRDDNAHLWWPEAADRAQLQWSAEEVALPPDAASQAPDRAAPAPDTGPVAALKYPEWDRLVRGHRHDWCTVLESRPPTGEPAALQAKLSAHAGLLRQLERSWRMARGARPVLLRAQWQGDALDIDAAVASAIERRVRHTPRLRIYQRLDRRSQETAVLLLLDASASTADRTPAGPSVLERAVEAALLTASACTTVGDRCAVHAFASNGRHEVRYQRALDFGEPLDALALARLAAIASRLSTRMGAALRHASALLAQEASRTRLLVLVTDGEPHDIDIHDRRYLIEDARRAVVAASRLGIRVFCISLDPADACARQIFGAGGYRVLDRIEGLTNALQAAVRTGG
ncbi:nitric oxide reductase activation protein NorD [Xylophilus sp. GOD-11R]|uniref:nitric oxide reductase activation protein NorD n=1 Tax=Xylophilus sp. GOD-11R TaxID=3089814 RepID=UPI00298CD3D2|nr:VWA domain-containing protein [Xylophilus sp. GOD-11R]WPB57429.1 VWA domain-containing protein [Xylophilus sp. GOD-11R]